MTTSSTTLPTDHATAVRRLLSVASRTEPEGIRIATRAQVHATLTLATEQRTANLIAYLAIAQGRPTADRLRDDIES
ncbi:hypothetical protein QUV83_16280, partial [Cellulomonas cellasea]|uniref:hypothetical protein n=1 Tax=Cellulomonas cellasea TaxID=43670 RepID=UPI0025A368E6